MKLLNKPEVSDVISHDVSPLVVSTDPRYYSRIGWLIVLLGVGGFLLWAFIAPLDKGVPVSGTVSVATNRKAVQYIAGGTVEDILVKEGDTVKAGQVLVKMNDTQVRSSYDVSKAQFISAKASEARLLAERDGRAAPVFPDVLTKDTSDPRVAEAINMQTQLFASRQAALRDDLAATDENMAGLQSQFRSLQESSESKKAQQAMIKEQLDSMRDLAKDGFVARNRLLELERTGAQLDGSLAEDRGNQARLGRQINELQLRKMQRTQEYQREVRTQLADVSRDAEALTSRLVGQKLELDNTLVRSPVDGIVVGMAVFTRGGVVGQGFRMMDVVPSGDALVIEGRIPVNLVDRVHVGLKVDLIFSAFNQNSTPHIPGEVTTVSADRLVDEHNGAAYYTMLARITPEGLKQIAKLKLQLRPGMPAELFVHTGERTMMNYLLKPVRDRAKTSLSEE
jgi:membrane fusion protein, protease secretion system